MTGDSSTSPTPAAPPPCLLRYEFATAPSPLRCSTPAAEAAGRIEIAVSAPAGRTIYCRSLEILVPVGKAEGDLCAHDPRIVPSTGWWKGGAPRIVSGEEVGLAPDRVFYLQRFSTEEEHWKIDYPLSFQVSTGAVNEAAGRFPLTIAEQSGEVGEANKMITRHSQFELLKAPPQLFLANFVAVAPGDASGSQPRGEFGRGDPIKLDWETNATEVELWAAGEKVWTGAGDSRTLAAGRQDDTTFTLRAENGAEVRSATFTVTISNPDIAPAAVEAGALRVTGESRLAAVSATGDLDLEGALGVIGSAGFKGALSALGVAHDLTATKGPVAFGKAAVGSTLSAKLLKALGAQVLKEGEHRFSADGLVLGNVTGPGDGKLCYYLLRCTSAGEPSVEICGGDTLAWKGGKSDRYVKRLNRSFVVPVRANRTFRIASERYKGDQANAAIAFYYLGLGSPRPLEPDGAKAGAQESVPALVRVRRMPVEDRVAALVAVLGEMFAVEATEPVYERTESVFRRQVI